MSKRTLAWLIVALFALSTAACSESSAPSPDEADLAATDSPTLDHVHNELVFLAEPADVARAFAGGVAHWQQDEPFRQVGFFYSADAAETLEWRVRFTDGRWSEWTPAEVTWQEGALHVGRAIVGQEALELELRGAQGLRSAQVEFFDKVVARTRVLTRDLPFEGRRQHGDYVTVGQKVAPRSLVIPRADWGARDPNKVCGSAHNPYRMAIHHTYSPANDGGDAARTIRGIQAYHIDTRGWCDIGYHFVVSQSAKIYQGRSSEQRTGAHVGGENTGNIGICLIGNFQPGYSTTQTPSQAQLSAASRIVAWVHQTYGIPLDRSHVKGHREHDGQTTSCPGDNLLNKIPDILSMAAGGGGADYDISVKVNWLGTDNFYKQGASAQIADALPGNTFKAEILVKNKSADVIRNVWAGYLVETPYLKATNYTIYTDYPDKDGQSWTVNDADTADENPPKDQMGKTGKFNLYAFSAGETKRILVDLKAKRYSVGAIDHPDVRGWVQHAEGRAGTIFGDRDGWGDAVETNQLGHAARGYAQMDVLDRNAWLFDDTSDEGNLEGWTGEGAQDFDQLKNNTSHGLLSLHVTGDDARIVSPSWTSVDADTFDQLVLRVRSHDGAHTKAVYWAGDGESFSEDRAVRFEAAGDDDYHDVVVPLGDHEAWTGAVSKLRVDLLDDRAPGADASGWYDVDAIYFQSSADQSTSAPGVDFADAAPVDLLPADASNNGTGGANNGTGGANNGTGGANNGTGGANNGMGADAGSSTDQTSGNVLVNQGCSAAGDASPSPAGAAWVVIVGLLALARRRRRG